MTRKPTLSTHLGLLLAAIAFAMAFKRVVDLDFWWHLATGRWIVEHRAFVTRDLFSFTYQNSPWVDLTWGFESLIYGLHVLGGGYWLVVSVMALLAAVTVYLGWRIFTSLVRSADATALALGFLFFLGALPVLDLRWIQRPEQLSHLFGVVFLAVLSRWRARVGSDRTLWFLPLVQLLWVNSHGLFILGPFLVAVFLFCDCVVEGRPAGWRALARHPLLWALGGVLAACLVNPRFLTGALFPLHLWRVLNDPFFKSTIPEATPPLKDAVWGFDAWAFFIYGCAAFASLIVPICRRELRARLRQTGAAYYPIVFALIWVSLPARRNIALLVAWTLPWVAHFLAGEVRRWLRHGASERFVRLAATGVGAAALIAIVTNAIRPAGSPSRFGGEVARNAHPQNAAQLWATLPRPLHLFGGVHFSDYLLFAAPGYQPYLDGRFAEMYPKAHFQHYMEILAHPQLIDDEVRRLNLDGVALETENAMEHGLVQYLAGRPDWRVLFFDETSVVLLRGGVARELAERGFVLRDVRALAGETYARIERQFSARHGITDSLSLRLTSDHAQAVTRLAETLLLLGETKLAEAPLQRALEIQPRHPFALTLECVRDYTELDRVAQSEGGQPVALDRLSVPIARATESCTEALAEGNDREAASLSLGLIALNTGHPDEAVPRFESVVARNPLHYSAHLLLARALATLDRPEASERSEAEYRRAQALRPLDPSAYLELGQRLRAQGAELRARQYLSEAQAIQGRRMSEGVTATN